MNLFASIISFLVLFIPGGSEKLSDEATRVVQVIASRNMYESSHVGFAGRPSEQYRQMKILSAIASPEQLLELASTHSNGVVRVYAWKALGLKTGQERKPLVDRIEAVAMQLGQDSTEVFSLQGCIGGSTQVRFLVDNKGLVSEQEN
ncbi:MAG: hypothetical protein EOP49_10125 [Sphingobacteriales bacterium]|nr:MAG: hypothetical protein EOP49_10125 [Sphingobacteriales bacterium]